MKRGPVSRPFPCLAEDRAARWWHKPAFDDRAVLHAAELVAFDVLEPALRSRGNITARAREHYANRRFYSDMEALFRGEPSGRLILPTLPDLLDRVSALEKRVAELEAGDVNWASPEVLRRVGRNEPCPCE